MDIFDEGRVNISLNDFLRLLCVFGAVSSTAVGISTSVSFLLVCSSFAWRVVGVVDGESARLRDVLDAVLMRDLRCSVCWCVSLCCCGRCWCVGGVERACREVDARWSTGMGGRPSPS